MNLMEAGGKMIQSSWSEAEVRAMLDKYDFDYQKVELPYGLSTGGGDRSAVARKAFPKDMSGKSLFDLGCRNGYFGFEAERRGATRVVGGESNPNSLVKAELLADVLGSKAQFHKFDVERDPMPGTFDFVLCLNVLHHLRNPLATLDKLIDATRETLVLEIASLTPKDRRESLAARVLGGILNRLPILYVGGAGKKNKSGRSFFITESAIVAMLNKHRSDFAKVEITQVDDGKKGRFLVIARKRRIGHLILIVGTNAVGKSTLIRSFERGENADIADAIGLDVSSEWRLQQYNDLPETAEAVVPCMVLQYNVGKYLIDGDIHRYERGLLDLIRVAERVTIATMVHPVDKLRERYAKRLPTTWLKKKMRSKRDRKVHRIFMNLYSNPEQLAGYYRDWFNFARSHSSENYVIHQEDGYKVVTLDDWERDQTGSG